MSRPDRKRHSKPKGGKLCRAPLVCKTCNDLAGLNLSCVVPLPISADALRSHHLLVLSEEKRPVNSWHQAWRRAPGADKFDRCQAIEDLREASLVLTHSPTTLPSQTSSTSAPLYSFTLNPHVALAPSLNWRFPRGRDGGPQGIVGCQHSGPVCFRISAESRALLDGWSC